VNDTLKSSSAGENPWKLALEGSGVGVWDWDIATGEQTHSPHWEEMLGFSAGELAKGYQVFVALVHPDDLAMVQTAARTYMEGRAPEYSVDFRMLCKDGSWKWILTRGMVVERDAGGAPLRMIGTHTDISERKRAEDELRALNAQLLENSQLLQTTLTSISQGILLVDVDHRVRMFNPRVCELLNLPERLLAQRPYLTDMIRHSTSAATLAPARSWWTPRHASA
jgi:PAS domain S-box-containing protein